MSRNNPQRVVTVRTSIRLFVSPDGISGDQTIERTVSAPAASAAPAVPTPAFSGLASGLRNAFAGGVGLSAPSARNTALSRVASAASVGAPAPAAYTPATPSTGFGGLSAGLRAAFAAGASRSDRVPVPAVSGSSAAAASASAAAPAAAAASSMSPQDLAIEAYLSLFRARDAALISLLFSSHAPSEPFKAPENLIAEKFEKLQADVKQMDEQLDKLAEGDSTTLLKAKFKRLKAQLDEFEADNSCVFSARIMDEPVQVSSGAYYEKAFINHYLKEGNTRCPLRSVKLNTTCGTAPDPKRRAEIQVGLALLDSLVKAFAEDLEPHLHSVTSPRLG